MYVAQNGTTQSAASSDTSKRKPCVSARTFLEGWSFTIQNVEQSCAMTTPLKLYIAENEGKMADLEISPSWPSQLTPGHQYAR
jgi:hypothetical protein